MKKILLLLLACSIAIGQPTAPYKTNPVHKIYKTGLKIPADWKLTAPFDHELQVRTDLPETWDWRTQIAGGLEAVHDQGQCGSCWAFALTEMVESAFILFRHEPNTLALAEQELVSCNTQNYGCNGGYFDAADYQKDPGQALNKDFPYKASDVQCKSGLAHDHKIVSWAYVGGPDTTPTVEQLRTALYEHGPLAVAVAADNDFMNYSSGVFTGNSSDINHMVVLDGYDNNQGYWILRNSWGKSWGDKGFMKIAYGANHVADIAAYAMLDATEQSMIGKKPKKFRK